ncbi:TPA: Gfo/Idh/MocA family oxidoreductase [Candidatus Poribacteria bacterium]|nr:Gfo/Idh/MocA family oxidoreductase [Candidatus Poribacteria bacterium]
MSNTKYRVGIIGCGSIANAHARGYQGVDEVEMVAIADPVDVSLNDFGDRYDIEKRYHDAREMLDNENLDIVSVATWHKLHSPMTIAACARKPKAVLCEKPMATDLNECDEMLISARRNDVKVAIAHQRRFNSAWTDARNLIADGAIGQPTQIVCRGGQGLLNDCSHLFDMMRYVLSDPNAEWVIGNVERKTERYERETPIEDRSAGIIGFENGCIGMLLQEIAGPNYQGGIIYGSDGIIDLTEGRARLLNNKSTDWEERPSDGKDQQVAQASELVEWIEGKTEHRGDAENGRAAVEIIMAIYESARMHEVVQMPVRTLCSPLELMIDNDDLPVERPGRYDIRAFLLRGESMRPK